MKQILSIIAAMAICISVCAEEVTLVAVSLRNGTKELYNLPDKPQMRFEGDDLIIQSEIMQGEYVRSTVEKISTERGERQASMAEVEKASFMFSYDGTTVTVTSPSVTLYDLNGMQLFSGKGSLDVSALPAGVYIVVPSNHSSIKIVKK